MDFLKAEIARKKKLVEESKVMVPDKKYFKRGELAAKQEEEYWKKSKRFKLEQEHEEQIKHDEEEKAEKQFKEAEETKKEEKMLPRKEVIRRLRERVEPVRLYGETDFEAYQRLKKLEIMAPEMNKGFKNDFKAAMDKVDEDYLQEILKASGESEHASVNDVKSHDDGTTMELLLKLAEKLGTGDPAVDNIVVLKFLKFILNTWAHFLNSRSEEEKRSFKGKLESATHKQTVDYLKPLFRKLKQKAMDADILACMVDIVKFMFDRNYIQANDAYLEMAIGNAPWPIGVTMVGIHARTGREKIFARNVAHVLNDETQRKYIQAMKRLMTQCQKFFPTDPSRSVDYEPEVH